MTLRQVPTSGGQVSGVDDLSSAPSSVINWECDDAGINRPRPGLATHALSNFGTSQVIGLHHWQAYVIVVTADRKIWAIHDSVPAWANACSTSSTATQLEGTQRPTFVSGNDHVYIAGGGRIQRWNPATVYAELVSASPNTTHIATLGGFLIANDVSNPSQYLWSEIGEGAWTSWPAANGSTSDARPDPIIAIYDNTTELFVWGTESVQVYAIGSDPTLPFDRVAATSTGLKAPYACVLLGEEFAVLDSTDQLSMTNGRTFVPFGDAIKGDLRSLMTFDDCFGWLEERGQWSFVVWRFPTETRTFVYDVNAKKFHERKYYLAPFQSDWPVTAYCKWDARGYHLFGSSLAAAGLMRFDEDSRQDLSGPLVCERVEGWQDFGNGNRKRSTRVRATFRRGTATLGATPGALEVRVQDTGKTWTPWVQMSCGVPSDYEQEQDTFATNGIFRRRRYHTRFSTTEAMSLVSLHDDVTEVAP